LAFNSQFLWHKIIDMVSSIEVNITILRNLV